MKQLSYWGILNPVKAIIVIVLCQLMLALIAVYSGIWLFAKGLIIPVAVQYIGIALFFIALICYPIRRAKHKFWKYNYLKHKTMDFAMLSSFLLIAVTMANADACIAWRTPDVEPAARQIAIKINENTKAAEKSWRLKELRNSIKHDLKKNVAKIKADVASQSNDAASIALIVLLALALMVLVAFLACNVICSGSDAGGVLILILGWALIIGLSISIIRNIKGKRESNYVPKPAQ